jgi:AraC family transcriptional regulator
MHKSNDLYRSRINQVIDHVNNNLDRSISLDELASVAFFSPFHFHRIFVAVTGETVNNFTNRMRNEKAARLLKFSKRSIAEISIECGFSSTSTMTRSFKQYFEVTPGQYKKGQQIKSSKIRKELHPITDYHCNMTHEELERIFPVQIKKLPVRRIAYKRVLDAFADGVVLNAFAELINWSKEMNLYHTETIFGMSKDDPEVTPKEKYRYEVCITIPNNIKIDSGDRIQTTTLPAGKYAVIRVSGALNLVSEGINYLFNNWLINSSYECEPQHSLEVFLEKEDICNWNHFDLEICIPVKPMNKY